MRITTPLPQGIKRKFPEQETFQTGLGKYSRQRETGPVPHGAQASEYTEGTDKGTDAAAGQESSSVGRETQAGQTTQGATGFHHGGSELQHLH